VSVQNTTYERSTLVNDEKYIGLDVHQATIVVAVMDSTGKLVMESILETKAATILQFFAGLRGTLSVIFEEGTWSAWLYDLLHSRVDKRAIASTQVIVGGQLIRWVLGNHQIGYAPRTHWAKSGTPPRRHNGRRSASSRG
jgi:hypothetical protein